MKVQFLFFLTFNLKRPLISHEEISQEAEPPGMHSDILKIKYFKKKKEKGKNSV